MNIADVCLTCKCHLGLIKTDKWNYRPISVIDHIAKIIEREIKNQIVTYLEENELITIGQCYRSQHSTQTTLH